MHKACTFLIDARLVSQCAHDFQDKALIRKLSSGDMIAQEAKYYARYLVSLYNKASRNASHDMADSELRMCEGFAL